MKLRPASVFQASLVVFLLLVGAKILNFLKKILIGKCFGVSWVADAFFAASYLPYYVAIFFEGVIFLSFLPLFSQIMAEKGKEEADQFVSEILGLVIFVTGLLVILAWWGAPWLIRQLVPGFNATEQNLTRSLFQILSLVVIFMSLTSFFKALNTYFEHYALAAFSTVIEPAVGIAVMIAGWKVWGIYAVAWGSVAGALAAFGLQAFFLFQRHFVFPKRFCLQRVWINRLLYFLIPMTVIWGFQQIPIVILNRFGSGMWEGTISSLSIAQTLMTVPAWLVSHTVLCAIFPSLAKQATEMAETKVRETFFQTLRGAFLILIPIGFLLTGLARPITILFFNGGGISEEGIRRIANSLTCLGWATFALYADLFMTQSLIAVRKTIPAIFLCATRAVLTYGIGYFLTTVWDYQGLALSFALALVINLFVLFPVFFRMSPLSGKWKDLFVYSFKLLLASSPAFLLRGWVNHWSIAQWMHFSQVQLILATALGFLGTAGFYFFLLFKLKVEEIHTVTGELKRGWDQKSWWFAEPAD